LRVPVEAMRRTLVPAGSASTRIRWELELQERQSSNQETIIVGSD
jgi:hypothetical protein